MNQMYSNRFSRLCQVLIVAVVIAACGGSADDIVVPKPQNPRTDILYGYYASLGEQVAEVKDHTNLHWEAQFDGPVKAAQNIRDAKTLTVLDVGYQLFTKYPGSNKLMIHPDAETRLRGFLSFLKTEEVLHYVEVIYPLDEPNLNLRNVKDIYVAVDVVKRVASEFQELDGYKLGVIYWDESAYTGIELFDWVGFDNYDAKSSILIEPDGRYFKMLEQLRPDQMTMLVPGGAFGQDPTPFVNFAQGRPEVVAIIPFVWFDVINEKETFLGIKSKPDIMQKYIAAGKEVTGK